MSHRDRLLEAARTRIVEKGFAATTARDLVAASETNLGSIGYHFGSREALLSQALEELFDEWTELLAGAAFSEQGAPPLERVTASWKATLDSLDHHRRPSASSYASTTAAPVAAWRGWSRRRWAQTRSPKGPTR
jgi:AcrR family transcriptional regulator